MSDLPPDRREHLRPFIPAETAQKILAAGISGERRVVTALFCDVVGSTMLGERLGPERFKVVMDQVLGRIIGAIARYGDPPPLGRIAWIADYPDPDNVLRVVFHSTSGHNFARFRNDVFDRLVEEAQRSTDQRQRMRIYHEADRLLVAEEAAIIPLGYTRTMTLVQLWVKGWQHWGGQVADLIVERPT